SHACIGMIGGAVGTERLPMFSVTCETNSRSLPPKVVVCTCKTSNTPAAGDVAPNQEPIETGVPDVGTGTPPGSSTVSVMSSIRWIEPATVTSSSPLAEWTMCDGTAALLTVPIGQTVVPEIFAASTWASVHVM